MSLFTTLEREEMNAHIASLPKKATFPKRPSSGLLRRASEYRRKQICPQQTPKMQMMFLNGEIYFMSTEECMKVCPYCHGIGCDMCMCKYCINNGCGQCQFY
jgi:hypothetical protein